ncbi:MAG: NAD-dependent epimerase/dehydratase family protein [Legionella sp.]|nr:NAD-dependent epimerase/dehydratase family protein [Legionella sp.]
MALNAAVLGAGFIGRNFIRFALQQGYCLNVLDHKECPDEFAGRLTWVKGEFDNKETLKKLVQGTEVIFHFIANTVPGDAVDESSELISNVVQTLQLLKLCVQEKTQRIIFISSASVYGVQTSLPIKESAPTDPISSHGIQKLTIEKYLQLYKYQHGLDCKIVRLSNPYGPGQSIHGRQGFIAIATGKILSQDAITIRGDGSIIRDFVYIDDVAETLHLLATSSTEPIIFNVGSGIGHALNDVIKLIERVIGRKLLINYIDNRFVDIPASVLDRSREKNMLGKASVVSLEEGLRKTFTFHGIKTVPNYE